MSVQREEGMDLGNFKNSLTTLVIDTLEVGGGTALLEHYMGLVLYNSSIKITDFLAAPSTTKRLATSFLIDF